MNNELHLLTKTRDGLNRTLPPLLAAAGITTAPGIELFRFDQIMPNLDEFILISGDYGEIPAGQSQPVPTEFYYEVFINCFINITPNTPVERITDYRSLTLKALREMSWNNDLTLETCELAAVDREDMQGYVRIIFKLGSAVAV